MAVGLSSPGPLAPVKGIRVGSASLGLRKEPRDDLAVFECESGTRAAAALTKNRFSAAPVELVRRHLQRSHTPRFLMVNSGNANAGLGEPGIDAAERTCAELARQGGCALEEVLPFSTGVIGEPLAVEAFPAAIARAISNLSPRGWNQAAAAIMTTDTVPKGASATFEVDSSSYTITGIAKGSGMIKPDMATMLAFVATDAPVAQPVLQQCLRASVDRTFNRVTVDGDTSTNDSVVLLATGQGPGPVIDEMARAHPLATALDELCRQLAQALVRDGEGATKFITVEVAGGRAESECLAVAYTLAHSPLVKTAMFASDANWGRLLAAVGRAPVDELQVGGVAIFLGELCIAANGMRHPEYTEEAGSRLMAREEIHVRVELGRGEATATIWTTDLSHDYVTINAEYRS